MRHVLCALSLGMVVLPAVDARNSLTLLIKFEGKPSNASVESMKKELRARMRDVDLDWRLLDELGPGESFTDLVVVRFKGVCAMPAMPAYLLDERGPGPLGFTHTSDGAVLPFSEVECDQIASSVRSAMHGANRTKADDLLGRAMGRVLAHELYHVIENTRKHQRDGVNQRSLTARQLICDFQ